MPLFNDLFVRLIYSRFYSLNLTKCWAEPSINSSRMYKFLFMAFQRTYATLSFIFQITFALSPPSETPKHENEAPAYRSSSSPFGYNLCSAHVKCLALRTRVKIQRLLREWHPLGGLTFLPRRKSWAKRKAGTRLRSPRRAEGTIIDPAQGRLGPGVGGPAEGQLQPAPPMVTTPA